MPAAEGTEVRHGSAQYYMCDWFANILSVIGLHEALNKDAKWRFPRLRREDILYNPEWTVRLIQYREARVRGCNFIDDCCVFRSRIIAQLTEANGRDLEGAVLV
ncbi:hypothetical protein B0H13DRAFT_1850591 [Mycena leptocephala]|nr:hypothetical protein B0H13DRAFT_1850591 [Mycena leptocephala]